MDNQQQQHQSEGMGAMEVEQGKPKSALPPRRQISNLSLPKKKSDIAGASSNLVNSIVGAGIIGIPFALRESGLVAGVILLLLVSYFTDKSLRMLIEMASFHPRLKGLGVLTFEDLMSIPFGHWGHHFILASMLVAAYGAMVAYLLIVKDTLPVVLGLEDEPGSGGFVETELVMLITSLCIMVPLSCQRDMSTLSVTSFLSVMCDGLLVLFVAFFSPIKEATQEAGGFGQVLKANWINGSGFFIGFGVLTIAMTCQHSAFIVSGSLGNLTSSRWATVTCRSLSISFVLCTILGVTGYLGYLEDTQGDILNNFDPDTVQASASRVLLAITMFFTYPMESFVARHVLIKLVFDGDMDGHSTDESSGESSSSGMLGRRQLWTMLIYICTLIPALIVDDLGPVLSITGAVGGCSLAYIGPGLAYLGVHGDEFLKFLSDSIQHSNRKSDPTVVDLPADGDATAKMQKVSLSSLEGSKPWWWWPMLMPIWVSIAKAGSTGMSERLSALEDEHVPMPSTTNLSSSPAVSNDIIASGSDGNAEIIPFQKRDAYIAMFFISFGTIAMAAGIVSNVYVQVNNVFYTPT